MIASNLSLMLSFLRPLLISIVYAVLFCVACQCLIYFKLITKLLIVVMSNQICELLSLTELQPFSL